MLGGEAIEDGRSKSMVHYSKQASRQVLEPEDPTPDQRVASCEIEEPETAANQQERFGFEDSDLILCSNSISGLE